MYLLPLEEDLEGRYLRRFRRGYYARSSTDEILLGPIPVGINTFILQADAPDISQIPNEDILGVTVVLVTCSYREKEFVRVGYYVNNEYDDEMYNDDGTTVGGLPPKPMNMNKVRRIVLADKPRVTRFPIQWGDQTEEEAKETTLIVLGTSSSSSNDDGIIIIIIIILNNIQNYLLYTLYISSSLGLDARTKRLPAGDYV